MENKIKVKLDYYGNKEYGKRVYWVIESPIHPKNSYVWRDHFDEFEKEMSEDGYEIVVTE